MGGSKIDLDLGRFLGENEMRITVMDVGQTIPSNDNTLKMFILPKIMLRDPSMASVCTVVDELVSLLDILFSLRITGLSMFILRTVIITILMPIPIIELILVIKKHPYALLLSIISKLVCVITLLCFIIEGYIVRYLQSYKTELQERIQNVGW